MNVSTESGQVYRTRSASIGSLRSRASVTAPGKGSPADAFHVPSPDDEDLYK